MRCNVDSSIHELNVNARSIKGNNASASYHSPKMPASRSQVHIVEYTVEKLIELHRPMFQSSCFDSRTITYLGHHDESNHAFAMHNCECECTDQVKSYILGDCIFCILGDLIVGC